MIPTNFTAMIMIPLPPPSLSKQMQMLPIIFQTSDTACHAEGQMSTVNREP